MFVNGLGAVTTGVVTLVIGFFKFTHGAWFIIVLVPVMVALLVRLNHAYETEKEELEDEAHKAAEAPILRYHSVIVLVEQLDQSSARAIQYARTLTPDDLKAVHFATDEHKAERLADEWASLGLSRLPLEIVECPDRRINRAVLEVVAEAVADGNTEVSVLIPRREYSKFWHRFLHDHTADSIAKTLTDVPHANVTFVPYHLGKRSSRRPGWPPASWPAPKRPRPCSRTSPSRETPPAPRRTGAPSDRHVAHTRIRSRRAPGGVARALGGHAPRVLRPSCPRPRPRGRPSSTRRPAGASGTSSGVSGYGCGVASGPCGCSRGKAAWPRWSAPWSTTPAAWS